MIKKDQLQKLREIIRRNYKLELTDEELKEVAVSLINIFKFNKSTYLEEQVEVENK